jgi:AcrR family transcriptional regulator
MDATESLLKTHSPVDLTAVAISKEAGISSATFYLYFEDVKNVLLALSQAAAAEMGEAHRILEEPWDVDEPDFKHAQRVVSAFYKVYDRHRTVLTFCSMEADRGDEQFDAIRLGMLVPFFKQFAERIYESSAKSGGLSRGDAYAEAIVFVAAMERNATSDPKKVQSAIGVKRLQEAMTRLIAWRFSSNPAAHVSPAARRKKADD